MLNLKCKPGCRLISHTINYHKFEYIKLFHKYGFVSKDDFHNLYDFTGDDLKWIIDTFHMYQDSHLLLFKIRKLKLIDAMILIERGFQLPKDLPENFIEDLIEYTNQIFIEYIIYL